MSATWVVMMTFVALVAATAGFGVAVWGSRVVVRGAGSLAAGSRVPPFIIGLTLLALGTDLPEIANSIIASVTGHGDLNVGDSIGSTVTQVTLILGLLPILAGAFVISRRTVASIGVAIVAALGVGLVVLADGRLSRLDGVILLTVWVVASLAVARVLPRSGTPELPLHGGVGRRLASVVGGLAVVAAGATAAIQGLIVLAEALSVPEYVISFFGASIGTSLPELIVDLTALRRGDRELAIGDVFGSSLVDASLSIGVGPLVAPVAVSAGLAVRGSLAAMAVVGAVVMVLVLRERHDRVSGVGLLLVYAAFYPLMLA